MSRPRMPALAVVCILAAMVQMASAQDLWMIDFNSNQSGGGTPGSTPEATPASALHNQAGWSSYHARHEVIADFQPATYTSMTSANTMTITPAWPNSTNANVQQSIGRGGGNNANWNDANGDLNIIRDWIGIDTRGGNGGNGNWDGTTGTPTYMTLSLSGLTAGSYDWTSFHHDTEHVHGDFSVELSTDGGANFMQLVDGLMTDSTAGGSPDSTTGGFGGPEVGPDVFTLSSVYVTSFNANGTDDVVFRFAPFANTAVHRQLWGLNGFILEQQAVVPEPASIAIWSLIGLGLAGFGYYRTRRKK